MSVSKLAQPLQSGEVTLEQGTPPLLPALFAWFDIPPPNCRN